jgi:DNA-binding CsgD family transcriptional regulator
VLDVCRAEAGGQVSRLPSRNEAAPNLAEALTWRELDVLQLMAEHHTNKEIARLLGIAGETVKRHAANIYGKLDVKGRRDASIRAYELGILRAEARPMPRSV